MPLEKKTKIPLLKCLECDYSTIKKGNMDRHKKNHQRDGKLKCPHCSFSSDLRSSLALNCKHVHQGNLKLLDAPARIQEVIFFISSFYGAILYHKLHHFLGGAVGSETEETVWYHQRMQSDAA